MTKKKSRISKTRLNVICHGLMVFWFDATENKVVLRIPRVPGHSYGAGFRGDEKAIPPDSGDQNRLRLENATAGSCSTANPNEYSVLDQQNGTLEPNPTMLHRSIRLPFPDDVLGFRVAQAPGQGFFSGAAQAKYKVDPKTLPMIHVFTYGHFSKPVLRDDTTTYWRGGSRGPQNLHIFAEPVFSGEHHWHYLTGSFKGGLDLSINPDPVPFEPPNRKGLKYGISPADMKSLQERNIVPMGGPPPNCMPIFVV